MFSRFLPPAAVLLALPFTALCNDDGFRAPDSLVLKDGTVVRGLIVKNTRDEVVLQEQFTENAYAKSEIIRIRDEPDGDSAFTGALRRGDLPSWRVIANDLRLNDRIKSLVEIPATVIDAGVFQNVPYKSFRVNRDVELNIYGDPEDPAGIELGIYGPRRGDDDLRRTLREYLAGFLTSRAEVAALYAIPFSGGLRSAGPLSVEITPPEAPDGYGAWWVSLFNPKRLEAARLDPSEYARLVRPMDEVIDHRGRVKGNVWTDEELAMSERADGDAGDVIVRGFYRDKNGVFRLIEQKVPRAH